MWRFYKSIIHNSNFESIQLSKYPIKIPKLKRNSVQKNKAYHYQGAAEQAKTGRMGTVDQGRSTPQRGWVLGPPGVGLTCRGRRQLDLELDGRGSPRGALLLPAHGRDAGARDGRRRGSP